MSNEPLSEQFRIVAKQWVEADAAASVLEETKSAVLSQRMLALGEMTVSKAEMTVKGSPEWTEHVTRLLRREKRQTFLRSSLNGCACDLASNNRLRPPNERR